MGNKLKKGYNLPTLRPIGGAKVTFFSKTNSPFDALIPKLKATGVTCFSLLIICKLGNLNCIFFKSSKVPSLLLPSTTITSNSVAEINADWKIASMQDEICLISFLHGMITETFTG